MNGDLEKAATSAVNAKVCGTVEAKNVRGTRSVAEMIIHSEGNLVDLRRHNDMLRFMIRQIEGTDEGDEPVAGEGIACGWNPRLNDVTTRTSQELANQASLTMRLAELLGLDV